MKLTVLTAVAVLLVGCGTVRDIGHALAAVPWVYYDDARGLINPNWEAQEVEAIWKRNNCPPPNNGVFINDTCKLSEPDERKMEKWRRMAIPEDCKSQWPTDPPDPCWAREFARQAAWDKAHP